MRLNKSGPPYTTWPDKHSGPLGLCELVESGPLSLERAKDAIRQKLRASSGEGDTIGDRIQAKIAPYERIQPRGWGGGGKKTWRKMQPERGSAEEEVIIADRRRRGNSGRHPLSPNLLAT